MIEHLGDITKISSRTAHPVRVIIGGSPCQDLSVAEDAWDWVENAQAFLWSKSES